MKIIIGVPIYCIKYVFVFNKVIINYIDNNIVLITDDNINPEVLVQQTEITYLMKLSTMSIIMLPMQEIFFSEI